MDCSEYQAQFTAFLDGYLATGEQDRLNAHLKECSSCYRRWCSLQQMQEILNQLPELDPPEHLVALVMARLKRRRFHQLNWLFGGVPRWIPLGVGVAALLLVSLAFWRNMPSHFPWQSKSPASQNRAMTGSTPSGQPAAAFTASQGSYSSDRPIMILKVKDFSSADQELESMLRSFSRSTLPERKPVRSVRTKYVRLFNVQVSGQHIPHLFRELHKIGHLTYSQLEVHKVATLNQRRDIPIRIVVITRRAGKRQ